MKKVFLHCIGQFLYNLRRLNSYFIRKYEVSLFKSFGKGSFISTGCTFTFKNTSIGSNTYIGKNCVIQSEHGEIIIGNNVMFGAGVHIHGGNHEYNHVGVLMRNVSKTPDSDGRVVIEDDVWIGSNAIILKGVVVGRGSVIGAGSIVTKDVEPYTIVVGNPAHKIKERFTEEELKEHKRLLSLT